MCRWLMYHGDKIKMSDLLVDPENSLMHQSIHSSQGAVPVNGDGFGIGWYTSLHKEPGVYKDPLPAWNNQNLISLAKHIKSRNFMAHVRASTIAPTASVNCHPFVFKNHLFMHNGSIANFDDIRQEIEQLIKPQCFKARFGFIDSEAMFLLAVSNGLENDAKAAIVKSIEQITKIQAKNGLVVLSEPLIASDSYTYVNNYTCIEIRQNEFKVEKL